ncbi:MAG TPA: F0F1 ATP synthase subunit gamma [Anaerolineae bacterium]|nr:F0F1 ATP synthase subunit gamma [Anaerolineae bacterium]HQK14050.1 F0F1 ATP synthase subunit gamma [Anaerolineae bacterium]
MAQDLERIRNRLDNIRSVGPILAALRTISLGSWQMALNRLRGLEGYGGRLLALLPAVLPYLQKPAARPRRLRLHERAVTSGPADAGHAVVVVIGSERGLCGRYNAVLVERTIAYMQEQAQRGFTVEIMALGSRLVRTCQRQKCSPHRSQKLPVTRLPTFELAYRLTRTWLQQYEAFEIDAVDVLYNAYAGPGRYTATLSRLLPPELPSPVSLTAAAGATAPYIIETDPLRLYAHIVAQWTTLSFYTLLLNAAAAEHAARFQLMESATQNVERLVEELTLELQSVRRQTITREMQELAVGAGLLEREHRPES